MKFEDVKIGQQYRWGAPDGPVVTVRAKHYSIDHCYIKVEEENRFDTTKSKLLFPIRRKK